MTTLLRLFIIGALGFGAAVVLLPLLRGQHGQPVLASGVVVPRPLPAAPAIAPAPPAGDADTPHGNPLRSDKMVMTQGYGVGTHAPAAIWGAIDLAIDSNGDGRADIAGSQGAPIYATHRGKVTCAPNTVPAGNHIWLGNDGYRTGYSHLSTFNDAVCGTVVEPGTAMGAVGSTGQASGPHLDYQVWVNENGSWVNHDPHEFGAIP